MLLLTGKQSTSFRSQNSLNKTVDLSDLTNYIHRDLSPVSRRSTFHTYFSCHFLLNERVFSICNTTLSLVYLLALSALSLHFEVAEPLIVVKGAMLALMHEY